MKRVLFIVFLIPWTVFTQTKESLTVEFSANRHFYEMKRLNEYLLDPNQNSMANLYVSSPTKGINEGYGFNLGVTYQPLDFLDVGVKGGYQYGNRVELLEYYSFYTNSTMYGSYEIKVQALGFGLVSTVYINRLLNFQELEPKFLNRCILGIEFFGGVGYSKLFDRYFENAGPFEEGNNQIDFTSTDFQGRVALKLGFNYLRNPLVSAVGVNFGYQFHNTGILENVAGQKIPSTNQTVSLDFSGVFFGAYLTVGK